MEKDEDFLSSTDELVAELNKHLAVQEKWLSEKLNYWFMHPTRHPAIQDLEIRRVYAEYTLRTYDIKREILQIEEQRIVFLHYVTPIVEDPTK